jgi:hypothetical protein
MKMLIVVIKMVVMLINAHMQGHTEMGGRPYGNAVALCAEISI